MHFFPQRINVRNTGSVLRQTLRRPFSFETIELWPTTLFHGKMCPRRNKVFLPTPLPTSLCNEACVFTTGSAAPKSGRLGFEAALDTYPQGQRYSHFSCPSSGREGSGSRSGVCPWPIFLRASGGWGSSKTGYIISGALCSKGRKIKMLLS